jgi:hypothetical protein
VEPLAKITTPQAKGLRGRGFAGPRKNSQTA